jgi:uncharacterized protein (TIGR03437 family)
MASRQWQVWVIVLATLTIAASAQDRAQDQYLPHYEVRDGLAIVDGDIVIGTAAELEAAKKDPARMASIVVRQGSLALWPDGVVPYVIDPLLPTPQRVLDAMALWTAATPIRFVERATENNYVQFTTGTGCSAVAGMAGIGQQGVFLSSGCGVFETAHEIGHSLGLWHEQSRRDTAAWTTRAWENMPVNWYSQFRLETNGRDQGAFDYASSMLYGPRAVTTNGRMVMDSVPPGIAFGLRLGLSPGDTDNISRLYGTVPTTTTIGAIPDRSPVMVDGVQVTTPRSFNWAPGSTHTISAFSSLIADPTRYSFVRWTDGGAAQHTVTAGPERTVITAQYQASYRLRTSVLDGNGTVTVDPPSITGSYPAGTVIRITAQPAQGSRFYAWVSTGLGFYRASHGAQSVEVELSTNLDVAARFTAGPITTIDTQPPGLLVTVNGSTTRAPVKLPATAGAFVNLATPASQNSDDVQNAFSAWSDGSTLSTRSLTQTAEDQTLTARFATKYYLDVLQSGSGSIAVAPAPTLPWIDAGTSVEVTATPLIGQTLRYWTGDLNGTTAAQIFTMDRPRRIAAAFGSALPFRVTNAASFEVNPTTLTSAAMQVAPLEIVTLFGTNLGPATLAGAELDAQGRVSTQVAGMRFLFDGIPAPIVYVSAGQSSIVVPVEVAGRGLTTISVERAGVVLSSLTVPVVATFPGLFTFNSSGSGPVAALNQDNSYHTAANGAPPGSVLVLFATGAGLFDRDVANGEVIGANVTRPRSPVYVRIDREPAEILYAGSAPGFVAGALQLNVRVPVNLLPGEHRVRLYVGENEAAWSTTMFVK